MSAISESGLHILEFMDENKPIGSANLKMYKNVMPGDDMHPLYQQLKKELNEYFEGNRESFSVPLVPTGTEFQRKVWNVLRYIPYGKTVSYQNLSRQIGDEKLIMAVGMANSKNPIAIMIPCHRVIEKDGKLTVHSGGIARKRFLISHERKFLKKGIINAGDQYNISNIDGI
jgi:O-6-methylguanine DNA methyltransferase